MDTFSILIVVVVTQLYIYLSKLKELEEVNFVVPKLYLNKFNIQKKVH